MADAIASAGQLYAAEVEMIDLIERVLIEHFPDEDFIIAQKWLMKVVSISRLSVREGHAPEYRQDLVNLTSRAPERATH